MGTDRLLGSVPDFRKPRLRSCHPVMLPAPSSRGACPDMFLFRVLKRDLVLAKMGTDRLLWSVPDFRSSASRDLALTNDFRTVALYHSLLTTHHSQPLLSSHIGSRSTMSAESGGISGMCFHPTLVLAQQVVTKSPQSHVFSFHPTLVLAQREPGREGKENPRFHPTLVLAQPKRNRSGWLPRV